MYSIGALPLASSCGSVEKPWPAEGHHFIETLEKCSSGDCPPSQHTHCVCAWRSSELADHKALLSTELVIPFAIGEDLHTVL